MIESVYGKPNPFRHKKSKYIDYPVHGFDTETPNFTIRLLPISDGVNDYLYDVTAENILDIFLEHYDGVKAKSIILFAHNLEYDFTVLMNQELKDDNNMQLAFNQHCYWEYRGCQIYFFNERPHFGSITFPNGKVIFLKDTTAFFGMMKLSKLAKILDVENKLEVDTEDFMKEGIHLDANFRKYAIQDARTTALIGGVIMDFHSMNNIKPCVSGPSMAMSIFRKDYLKEGEELICPNDKSIRHWELSYHGGKNGCYYLSPSEHKNVYLYDINSAYPFAMTKLPNFVNCNYETEINPKFDKRKIGIYQISCVSHCNFNSTFDHDFTSLKTLNKTWITSYELHSLLEHNCINKLKIHAAHFVKQIQGNSPLRKYAITYYKLKQNTPKDSALYPLYKITMLNSLYGKFIERRYDETLDYSLRGPNYNPAIASLITGHCRAQLHDMEHAGNALHSATDSVFTFKKMQTSKELGGISLEGFGKLQMFRNKVYLFWTRNKPKEGEIIKDKNGLYLEKYAYHGFNGTIHDLIWLWNHRGKPRRQKFKGKWLKKNEYIYKKMPTSKETLIHKNLKLKMFGMNILKKCLNIDWRNINV